MGVGVSNPAMASVLSSGAGSPRSVKVRVTLSLIVGRALANRRDGSPRLHGRAVTNSKSDRNLPRLRSHLECMVPVRNLQGTSPLTALADKKRSRSPRQSKLRATRAYMGRRPQNASEEHAWLPVDTPLMWP